MPHDEPRKLRRETDERLRKDREETDLSLKSERESASGLLHELEEALRRLHQDVEGAVELDHGADPWREESLRHSMSETQQMVRGRRSRGARSGDTASESRLKTMQRKLTRERDRTDTNLRNERAQMERLLIRATALASTDALTELVNARVFTEVLSARVDICEAGDQSFGLMYVDLDNFKRVNDLYGHVAGDELLRKISALIRRSIRKEDVAARLGGDEFGIAVSGLPREKVEAIATRLIESIQALNVDVPEASLGASLGLVYLNCGESFHPQAEELLRRADAAMYEAKASGKQTVLVTLPEDGKTS